MEELKIVGETEIRERKQHVWDIRYLVIARIMASCSYALRLKVGAVLVKDRRIISTGYNGTASGERNVCEEAVKPGQRDNYPYHGDEDYRQHLKELNSHAGFNLKTLPNVIHAEANAILKVAGSHDSSQGSTLYITHLPCYECSKMILGAGIRRVVYENDYRDSSGVHFLMNNGVKVVKVDSKEIDLYCNKIYRPNNYTVRYYGEK